MKSEDIKQECLTGSKWLRLVFMIVFATVSYFGLCLVWVISFFQFIFYLVTGKSNKPLTTFSSSLGQYISEIISYLCFNEEDKPFPFTEWPSQSKAKPKIKEPKAVKATKMSEDKETK